MPLVLGVDSSTQSTKVELRDADDGRLVAAGRAPHPATAPPRSEQDPEAWWAALREAGRGAAAGRDRRGRDRRPADGARDARRGRSGGEAGQALERHRVRAPVAPARRGARRGGVGARVRERPGRLVHDHQARVAQGAASPPSWARVARALVPHDWLTWRLTGRFVTDRGDASGTGWWSPAEEPVPGGPAGARRRRARLAGARCPRCSGRSTSPDRRPPTPPASSAPGLSGALVAPGTGDNMAAALGVGLRARRGRRLARHFGHGLRGLRAPRRRRRPAAWGASRTRRAATCPSCARSTRPR